MREAVQGSESQLEINSWSFLEVLASWSQVPLRWNSHNGSWVLMPNIEKIVLANAGTKIELIILSSNILGAEDMA